jgi:hypothetical protein
MVRTVAAEAWSEADDERSCVDFHMLALDCRLCVMRRLSMLAAIGVVLALAAVAVLLIPRSDGGAKRPQAVAVVWGNPIPATLFRSGMAARIRTIRAATGTAPAPGTSAYRTLQDQSMRQLVSDMTVVAEARRLGVIHFDGPVAQYVVAHADQAAATWEKLYDFAARSVPDPPDPAVVEAANHHDLPEGLSRKQGLEFNAWQRERDRVASAWFGRLFRRYDAHTSYAPGYRPAPP